MNVKMKRAELVRELGVMDKIVSRKPTLPVLGGVLMSAEPTGVVLSATDLEVAVKSSCVGAIAERGSAVLPARRLLDIARSLSGDEIQISTTGSAVTVTADGFRANLQTHNVDDFPRVPDSDGAAQTSPLQRFVLSAMIKRIRYAITEDDKRFYMAGALLEVHADSLRLVATDAKRLAVVDAPRAESGAAAEAILLPRKSLDALTVMLDDADDDAAVAMSLSGNHIFFAIGDRLLVSRTADGKFPQYQRIIPKPHDVRVVFARQAMLDACRRASMVAETERRAVHVALTKDLASVTSASAEVGDSAETVVVAYDGSNQDMTLNVGFVMDFLETAEAPSVSFERLNDKSAAVFRAADGDLAYQCVIMPLVL